MVKKKEVKGANSRQVGGAHYKSPLEHWDMVEEIGMGYLEGCATKYVSRWRKKNGLQDLEKGLHYVQKLQELHSSRIKRNNRAKLGPREEGATLMKALDFCQKNELTPTETAIVCDLAGWKTHDHLSTVARLVQGLIDGVNGSIDRNFKAPEGFERK